MDEIARLRNQYRDDLLGDIIPFWLLHAPDQEYGGYFTALARDGAVIDSDKSVWFQGRFAWVLSTLSADLHEDEFVSSQQRYRWLTVAKSGIDFLQRHCFSPDGQMYFTVTADGKPLRQRRYVFSEMFATMALAAYARATNDRSILARAERFLERADVILNSQVLPPKVDPDTRPMKGLALPMIRIAVNQELRKSIAAVRPSDVARIQSLTDEIEDQITEIEQKFLNEEFKAVLENVGPTGEFLDHFDGRTINPGHAIEAAWFILEEARLREVGGVRDQHYLQLGLKVLDWSWNWGWDKEYGGMLYFRDVRGLPVQEYWHDMKFWWPQNETIIATLLAFESTGDEKFLAWHNRIHRWAHEHFADPDFGEWFGYLHRDGRVSSTAKGTMWKGPFHLPRMQLVCWQICDRLLERGG